MNTFVILRFSPVTLYILQDMKGMCIYGIRAVPNNFWLKIILQLMPYFIFAISLIQHHHHAMRRSLHYTRHRHMLYFILRSPRERGRPAGNTIQIQHPSKSLSIANWVENICLQEHQLQSNYNECTRWGWGAK